MILSNLVLCLANILVSCFSSGLSMGNTGMWCCCTVFSRSPVKADHIGAGRGAKASTEQADRYAD